MFVWEIINAVRIRMKGRSIRYSSLWTVIHSKWIILCQIQCSGLNKYSFLRWERLVHTEIFLCIYITCVALIHEIGMCLNNRFVGWGMSVVSRTSQIHVPTIKFLAETFILIHGSSKLWFGIISEYSQYNYRMFL